MAEAAVVPSSGEYQEGKLWFERHGLTLTVGLTASALDDIGEVEQVELPTEGEDFEKGDVIANIDGNNGSLEIVAPATGTIGAINEVAQKEPDIITEDPLEEGWLFKIQIQDTDDLLEEI